MHVPAFGEERTHGFHRSPKRAFDPRAAKKHSIIKRFNVFGSLLFPPGGANLLWCSQKLNLLTRQEKF